MEKADYVVHDGLSLSALLRSGAASPRELLECAIGVAEDVNPKVNALCHCDYDQALALADKAEIRGAFGAVPFLLKDSGLSSTWLKSSVGSRLFAGMRGTIDATLTKRFDEAGLLPFGRTTVPEFCMAPTTEALQNGGPTRNPWNLSLSAGGSSGGAAVAVATGIVPLAHGSDGGGSIRIPASCCGVFGLKPSRGLVPVGPARGEAWGGLAADGVLSRSVRDTAAALDAIAGMETGAPYAAPAKPGSYLDEMEQHFERPMRIARWTRGWDDIDVAPECRSAIDFAADKLRSCGHEVLDAPLPDVGFSKFLEAMIDVMSASVTMTVNGYLRAYPSLDPQELLEPAIFDAYQQGRSIEAERYALAINRFHAIGRQIAVYMNDFDFILTPTLTQPPAELGVFSMADDFRSFRRKIGRYTTFLAIINASGQPAANVPLYWSETGLPIGIQLIGRFGDETGLLRLSRQLEQAAPWAGRWPVL